jgi:hypothetical protein
VKEENEVSSEVKEEDKKEPIEGDKISMKEVAKSEVKPCQPH